MTTGLMEVVTHTVEVTITVTGRNEEAVTSVEDDGVTTDVMRVTLLASVEGVVADASELVLRVTIDVLASVTLIVVVTRAKDILRSAQKAEGN